MEPTEGRWVCRRCFASNDADATTCAQCGLERGAEPSVEGADAQWTPPGSAAQSTRPMWQQLALRFWWVGLIVVVIAVGWYASAKRDDSGRITDGGTVEVGDLRVGDCFDHKDANTDEFGEVEAKPCTEPHAEQIFFTGSMPDGEYPTDDEIFQWTDANCTPAFESYVGTTLDITTLDFGPYVPTQAGWEDGDHMVLCSAFDPEDDPLTESVENSGL
jgi:hypothetical protein